MYAQVVVRIKSDSTNKFSVIYIYVCLLPSEVSLQLKNLLKNIYKSKCHEDETETIFKSPCLFTLNALIQFKQPMLVYFECFHLLQIAHACLRRIFQYGRVYLPFTYNDIYICYIVLQKHTFQHNLQRLRIIRNNYLIMFSEALSEPCETSNMEYFAKIVNDMQSLTFFAKPSILDV